MTVNLAVLKQQKYEGMVLGHTQDESEMKVKCRSIVLVLWSVQRGD